MRTISALVNELLAMEREFGDLPVKVEVFKSGDKNAVGYQSDFYVSSVMEDPMVEGEVDGVLMDSYGNPLPDGPTSVVITLDDDLQWKNGVVYGSDPRVEEARGWIAQILDTGIEDEDWPSLQKFYEELCDDEREAE